MSIIFIILLALLTVGAVVGWRLAKAEHALGMPMAAGCAMLVILLAFGKFFFGGDNTQAYAISLERFASLCGEQMGRYLVEHHPEQRVLILIQPHSEHNPLAPGEEALIEALQKTLRKEVPKADTLTPQKPEAFQAYMEKTIRENPEAYPLGEADFLRGMQGLFRWFGPKQFAALVKSKMFEYDLIVIPFDIPFDPTRLEEFKDPESPKLVLINASPRLVAGGMREGLILAAITHQPDPEAWKNPNKIPRNDQEAFKKRYLLITPENVEALIAKYPSHFKY